MLYYLFDYLEQNFDLPGAGLFRFLSFRAAMAVILSLFITLILGKKIINMLLRKQVGETIRDLGLEGQSKKQGTPTMGGLIIISAILIPVLLFTKLDNIYVILMVLSTVWLGIIGFIDDYIKVFKKDKKGLAGKFKVIGQIGLGIIVGSILYFNDSVVVRESTPGKSITMTNTSTIIDEIQASENTLFSSNDVKSTATTIPFMKNNEFDYSNLVSWLGDTEGKFTWLAFILVVILIVTAVSNGANITDGIDGLATGTSAIIGATLAVFAYVSGNMVFAD